MRLLRASFIALFTALVSGVLAFFAGDYLIKLGHMPNMEGGRGMFVVFVSAPLGVLVGFVTAIVSSLLVPRQGAAGFVIAQGWSLLIVCALAGCSLAFRNCSRTNRRASPARNSRLNSKRRDSARARYRVRPIER